MNCPCDGQALRILKGNGQEVVAVCGQCHGLWLNRETLRRLLKDWVEVPAASARAEPADTPPALRRHAARPCPACLTGRWTPRWLHGVEIDVCPACHGIWLDGGELEVITARYRMAQEAVYRDSKASRRLNTSSSNAYLDWLDYPDGLFDLADLSVEGLKALAEFLAEALSGIDF